MAIHPVVLFLLALSVDLGLSCLGKRFFLTYPASKVHKFIAIVTLYTYHEKVTITRLDKMDIMGLLHYDREVRTTLSLTRFRKVHLRLQFNASMYEDYGSIYHTILLEGDEDFGVNLMLLGQDHSVATMTIIPIEYHGTEYYPFFLSHNQVYIALVERLNRSRATLEITFYSNTKHIRTIHAAIDTHLFPYVCENNEAYASYHDYFVSTAAGFPLIVKGGTAAVIVGNCHVEEKRVSDSADCAVMKPDDLLDMSLAMQFGAKEFITFKGIHNVPDRSYVTVMGLQDSTSVKIYYKDETHIQLEVKTGQTVNVNLRDPYQLITSTRSIQVYLLFTSHCKEKELGGPSMTSLIPNALFHTRYIWSLPYYLKKTEYNYLVVIIRANKDYGFVYNGNNSATHKWSWSPVSGTDKWLASENEIRDFWEVFTFSSSTNRAFGLYLYGVDIAISYLQFVDFINAVTFRHRYICFDTDMVVGDLIDNDCDGFPDEESSMSSDDDGDGKRGEDVRDTVPYFFNQELTPPPTLPKSTKTTTRALESTEATETTDRRIEDTEGISETARIETTQEIEISDTWLIETTEQEEELVNSEGLKPPSSWPTNRWYLWLLVPLVIPLTIIIFKLCRVKPKSSN